jgi:hypothetical protein
MKMQKIPVLIITILLGLNFQLTACGNATTPSKTGTTGQASTTIDWATPNPTNAQPTNPTSNQATPTPTIDQATPTPTIDQAQPTPTPIVMPQVFPSSLNPGNCTATSAGWDCSVSLTTSFQQQVDWSVLSSDPAADVSYSLQSGTLSAENQYQQTVIISIATSVCQNSSGNTFVFSFASGEQTSIQWSCS